MNRSRFLVVIGFFTLIYNEGIAQKGWYVRFHGGPSQSFSDYNHFGKQPPEKFRKRQKTSAGAGVEFIYGLNSFLSIEAGVQHVAVGHGFKFQKLVIATFPNGSTQESSSWISTVGFSPLHFTAGLRLHSPRIGNSVFLHHTVGFAYMPAKISAPLSGGGEIDGIESVFLEYKSRTFERPNYCLRSGLGLNFELPNHSFITVEAIYNLGSVYFEQINLTYTFKGEPYQATIRNKLDYATLQIGYTMPVRKLWPFGKKPKEKPLFKVLRS